MTRMTETEVQKFWSNKQLKKKDWLSLTSYLLSDLFSPEFMIPLQTVDTTFALKVCMCLKSFLAYLNQLNYFTFCP